jgi:hypothetical protein
MKYCIKDINLSLRTLDHEITPAVRLTGTRFGPPFAMQPAGATSNGLALDRCWHAQPSNLFERSLLQRGIGPAAVQGEGLTFEIKAATGWLWRVG